VYIIVKCLTLWPYIQWGRGLYENTRYALTTLKKKKSLHLEKCMVAITIEDPLKSS